MKATPGGLPAALSLTRFAAVIETCGGVLLLLGFDNIVSPQESAILAGATIVRLSGMGHVSMPFSRRVREVALEQILAASG